MAKVWQSARARGGRWGRRLRGLFSGRRWPRGRDLRNWADGLETFIGLVLRLATLALLLLLGVLIYHLMGDQGYVLQPFSVPQHLEAAGYNGRVVAQRIQDQIGRLKEEGTSVKDDSLLIKGEDQPDLSLPIMGVGLSLRSVAYQLREVLGRRNKTIQGEITLLDDVYAIQVRMTDFPAVAHQIPIDSTGEMAALDRLLRAAAEDILGHTDPYRLALVCYRQRRFEEAIEQIRRMLQERPEEAQWAYLAWGLVLQEQGRRREAISKYERAAAVDPAFALPFFNLANLYEELGDIDAAAESLRRGLDIDPDSPWQWNYLGWLEHLREAYAASDSAYLKAAQYADTDEDLRAIYMNWSDKRMSRNDLDGALEVIEAVEDRFGEDSYSYVARCLHALVLQDTMQAYHYIKEAFAMDPSNPAAINIGLQGALLLADFEQALSFYRQAQFDQSSTEDVQSAMNLAAMAHNFTGGHDSAYALIQQAIRLDTTDATPYTTLAETHFYLERKDSCLFYLEKALRMGFPPEELSPAEPPYDQLARWPEFQALLERYCEPEVDIR